jgi:hypothetical protein
MQLTKKPGRGNPLRMRYARNRYRVNEMRPTCRAKDRHCVEPQRQPVW